MKAEILPYLNNSNYQKATIFRIFTAVLMLAMALIAGLFSLFILPSNIFFWVFASIGVVAFSSQLVYYFILKPKYIEIKDTGVLFRYIWKKNRFVSWKDVKFINLNKGDLSTFIGSDSRRGVLCDRKWHFYRMNYEVASAVHSAYIKKVGKEPPHDTTGASGFP